MHRPHGRIPGIAWAPMAEQRRAAGEVFRFEKQFAERGMREIVGWRHRIVNETYLGRVLPPPVFKAIGMRDVVSGGGGDMSYAVANHRVEWVQAARGVDVGDHRRGTAVVQRQGNRRADREGVVAADPPRAQRCDREVGVAVAAPMEFIVFQIRQDVTGGNVVEN